MKNIALIVLTILSLNAHAEGMSEGELSTILTISPFVTTTEAITDAFTTDEFEEAGQIIADGVVTEEERQEMSIELKGRLEECIESDGAEFESPEADCLKLLASYDY
ncbi:hypothetical protein ACRXCV_09615 [Halobacteriovorax sp. GFR7]|uniref:hypothetical protein n=1 Tax=unclassified Halobacteriovorax TaxID=2639665 RepID=UPI003721E559